MPLTADMQQPAHNAVRNTARARQGAAMLAVVLVIATAVLGGCSGIDAPALETSALIASGAAVQPASVHRTCAQLTTDLTEATNKIKSLQAQQTAERAELPTTLVRAFQRASGPAGSGLVATEQLTAAEQQSTYLTAAMAAKGCPPAPVP